MDLYKTLVRPLLFSQDPEKIHDWTFSILSKINAVPGLFEELYRRYNVSGLERELWGLPFPNPVGLAAGFDKDARLLSVWEAFGFGFVEIGTVTPKPQLGNPKKRLFRLPKDQAIINRMGFNNSGVDAMVEKLVGRKSTRLIVGANIGKNKDTPNEKANEDYLHCFHKLHPHVDYFVINVSSPNTPGLRHLQQRAPLTSLLSSIIEANITKSVQRPVLLKIAPDLSEGELDDILIVAEETAISGIIATNTTISREILSTDNQLVNKIGLGGLSGKPLTAKSQQMLSYLHNSTNGNLPLIGVGGIMSAQDAIDRMTAGASLIQVYTGFVYEGPAFIKKLLNGLLKDQIVVDSKNKNLQ